MTKQEFLDKYGEVWVHYTYRFNYMFTHEGDLSDDSVVIVHCGGQPDIAYDTLSVAELSKVKHLDHIMSAYVYRRGQLVEGFDE